MEELEISDINISVNDESSDSNYNPGVEDPQYQSGSEFNKLP